MVQKVLVLFALVLGGLLLYTNDINFFNHSQEKFVGDILAPKGMVLGRKKIEDSFENLKDNQKIPKSFEIVTGQDSHVKLRFGETFGVHEDSHVLLSKKSSTYTVKLLRGRIGRKSRQANTQFFIGNQKQTEMEIENVSNQIVANTLETKTFNAEGEVLLEKKDQEFQNLLEQTISGHQRFLERCFIKLYESNAGDITGGRILVRFKISKKGRVDSVKIKESRFKQKSFHECVEEVISRVRFKRYQGKERTVDLPIEIQLPRSI